MAQCSRKRAYSGNIGGFNALISDRYLPKLFSSFIRKIVSIPICQKYNKIEAQLQEIEQFFNNYQAKKEDSKP